MGSFKLGSPAHYCCLLTLASLLALQHAAGQEWLKIGVLLDEHDDAALMALGCAEFTISHNTSRISLQTKQARVQDALSTSRAACDLLEAGTVAMVGPASPFLHSACQALEVPLVTPGAEGGGGDPTSRWGETFTTSLSPTPDTLRQAYVDVVRGLGWGSLWFLHLTDNHHLSLLADLVADLGNHVTFRRLPATGDLRQMLREARRAGARRLVVGADGRGLVEQVLRQAQETGLLTPATTILFTSLDLHAVNVSGVAWGGARVVGLRLVDPDRLRALFKYCHAEDHYDPSIASVLTTQDALTYDAAVLTALAVDKVGDAIELTSPDLDCAAPRPSLHGAALLTHIRLQELEGLTGHLRLSAEGRREDFKLDLVTLSEGGLQQIGRWDPESRLSLSQPPPPDAPPGPRVLRVTTVPSPPFVVARDGPLDPGTSHGYTGFCIDLLAEITRLTNLSFEVSAAEDGRYGSYDEEQDAWNGMIGQLVRQEVDLAVGDLTITSRRENVVDFTIPFMSQGITLLSHKPARRGPSLFSFLGPLSGEVWLYLAAAFVSVTVLLYLLARVSPTEQQAARHCCQGEGQGHYKEEGAGHCCLEEAPQRSSLSGCLWFTAGSLVQKVPDTQPRGVSTRVLGVAWWVFVLLLVSAYTANLASFLTVQRLQLPLESVDDLAAQTKVKYGTVEGGTTWAFFRNSQYPVYQRMFSFMEAQRPSVLVRSVEAGVERVLREEGRYAFLMESPMVQFYTGRHCQLTQVGGLLNARSYGFALPTGSPYHKLISGALVRLQEDGILESLRTRWWSQMLGGEACVQEEQEEEEEGGAIVTLGGGEVAGIFAVLGAGMALACLVALCEMAFAARERKRSFVFEVQQILRGRPAP